MNHPTREIIDVSQEDEDRRTRLPPQPDVNLSRVMVTGSNVTLYTGNPYYASNMHSNPSNAAVDFERATQDTDIAVSASSSPAVSHQRGPPQQEEIGFQASNRIYERHMLTRGRGYPLWIPEGGLNVPIEKRKLGVSIGDVGMVTSTGCFLYLFNILLGASHPLQPRQLPEGYTPVAPLSPQSSTIVNEIKQNSALTSVSVRKLEISDADEATHATALTFELSSSEGAVLVLPDGAQSIDLQMGVVHWRLYMRANLEKWYRYVVGTLGCEVTNGDIRLVTGCDKTTFWGVAVAEHPSFSPNKCWLRFRPSNITSNSSETYTWDYNGVVTPRTGPSLEDVRQLNWDTANNAANHPNQCVYIRSLHETLHADKWASISDEFGLEQHFVGTSSGQPSGSSLNRSLGSSSTTGTRKGKEADSLSQYSPHSHSSNFLQDKKPNQRLYTDHHPADLVNQMLLALSPNSKAASCSDKDWCDPLLASDLPSSLQATVGFDGRNMLCAVFLSTEIEDNGGFVRLKSSTPIWQKLGSIYEKTGQRKDANIDDQYQTEVQCITDLIPVLDAFVKFSGGIETLKTNGSLRGANLLNDFDTWDWPFFRQAFGLLDVIFSWLLNHNAGSPSDDDTAQGFQTETTTALDVHPGFDELRFACDIYLIFRLTGKVDHLKTCTARLHLMMTGHLDLESYSSVSMADYFGSGYLETLRAISSHESDFNHDELNQDISTQEPTSSKQDASSRSFSRIFNKPLPKNLATLAMAGAKQHFIINGERWVSGHERVKGPKRTTGRKRKSAAGSPEPSVKQSQPGVVDSMPDNPFFIDPFLRYTFPTHPDTIEAAHTTSYWLIPPPDLQSTSHNDQSHSILEDSDSI